MSKIFAPLAIIFLCSLNVQAMDLDDARGCPPIDGYDSEASEEYNKGIAVIGMIPGDDADTIEFYLSNSWVKIAENSRNCSDFQDSQYSYLKEIAAIGYKYGEMVRTYQLTVDEGRAKVVQSIKKIYNNL